MKKDYIVEVTEKEADELMDGHWVRELVRCKDCKNCIVRAVGKTNRQGSPLEDGYFCIKLASGFGWRVKPDWFCADGERREGKP